jgi:hypothetical protein
MGAKYKITKEECRHLFGILEMITEGNWHNIYAKLGLRQGSNKNFTCINESAHGDKADAHPSMSIDNQTGTWHCFACQTKGNFQSYWRDYIKGNAPHGDSYTDFIIDFFGLSSRIKLPGHKSSDDEIAKDLPGIQEAYDKFQADYQTKNNHPHILSGAHEKIEKEIHVLDMKIVEEHHARLNQYDSVVKYLLEERGITRAVIDKFMIGVDEHGYIVFPQIDTEGNLRNIKTYNPKGNQKYKWLFPYKGYDTIPSPMNNFTYSKIYFFEGEPDVYCALSRGGMDGAVTLGSAANINLSRTFSPEEMTHTFKNKEIVICLDSDPAGIEAANKLANQLYSYAKQIKIIDLNVSDINPYGLDPEVMIDIKDDKGNVVKQKRAEKDFTDFLKKNGPWEQGARRFKILEDATSAFVHNIDRVSEVTYKVTLQEARHPKYYSPEGKIVLEMVGAVSDYNCDAYMYATSLRASCPVTKNSNASSSRCKECSVCTHAGIKKTEFLDYKLVRKHTKETMNDIMCIKVDDHDILGMIEVTEQQKISNQKRLLDVPDHCKRIRIVEIDREKMVKVRITNDPSEYSETDSDSSGYADINLVVYMRGDKDILPGRSYRFWGVQTTAWSGQFAVIVVHAAEPILNSIETFKINQEIHSMLKVFEPREGETVKDCLARKYKAFSSAAGLTGREDVFAIADLVFFSACEIDNKKLLPEIHKGWVEALIAGETRCGKTVVGKFLHRHYKIGEYISGSGAVTRSGLIGGVKNFENRKNISWGKIPMNDGGIIIIDEFSHIALDTLDDMTNMRSSGIADINTIVQGKAYARTRKLMLSNARTESSDDSNDEKRGYGIQLLLKLCHKPEIASRFDIAFYITQADVKTEDFAASYDQIANEYTEYQCSRHIMYTHSRKANQIKSEDGLEEYINECQIRLLKKFHSSTQLVNQEMRAKLVRLAVSTAFLVRSVDPNDWECIIVRRAHVDYVVDLLDRLYSHTNMQLDEYSKMKRSCEELGDMRFMMNISKYVDLSILLRSEDYNDNELLSIFYDYLHKVQEGRMYIVDAMTDEIKTKKTNLTSPRDTMQKLIGIMVSRNCLARTKRSRLRKTPVFSKWLTDRMKEGKLAEQSSILEVGSDEPTAEVTQVGENFGTSAKRLYISGIHADAKKN